jgi:hypothetical protein
VSPEHLAGGRESSVVALVQKAFVVVVDVVVRLGSTWLNCGGHDYVSHSRALILQVDFGEGNNMEKPLKVIG